MGNFCGTETLSPASPILLNSDFKRETDVNEKLKASESLENKCESTTSVESVQLDIKRQKLSLQKAIKIKQKLLKDCIENAKTFVLNKQTDKAKLMLGVKRSIETDIENREKQIRTLESNLKSLQEGLDAVEYKNTLASVETTLANLKKNFVNIDEFAANIDKLKEYQDINEDELNKISEYVSKGVSEDQLDTDLDDLLNEMDQEKAKEISSSIPSVPLTTLPTVINEQSKTVHQKHIEEEQEEEEPIAEMN